MANCGRGGSGLAPCGVLSSLCASCPLHNGLRKLDRGQVIGLEIDNNKTGPAVSGAPPAATGWGSRTDWLGRSRRGPAGVPRVPLLFQSRPQPPAQTPSATTMVLPASPCWGQQRGPVNPALEPIPLSCSTSAVLCLGEAKAVILLVTSPQDLAYPYPSHLRAFALPCPALSGMLCWAAQGPHVCGEVFLGLPHSIHMTFGLHCCLSLAGR